MNDTLKTRSQRIIEMELTARREPDDALWHIALWLAQLVQELHEMRSNGPSVTSYPGA